MAWNLICPDRDQVMLLPVDVREWLPEDDLVWHVLDVVGQLDLASFYERYRINGQGAAAYDPAMMVSLLVYAHAVGVKSSRSIERACTRDAGFKVAAGMLVPDHSTITRFLKAHQDAVTGLFAQVLRLCHAAGMLRLGVIAVDGTKIAANASWAKSYTDAALEYQVAEAQGLLEAEQAAFERAAAGMVAEQLAVDEAEDREHGPEGGGRGDDLPPGLRRRRERLEKLKAARADLAARDEGARARMRAAQKAKQEVYDAKTAAGQRPAGPRPKDEIKVGHAARARRGGKDAPAPRASVVDVDSRRMKAKHGFVQGYNAQVAVTTGQVVLAAVVSQEPTDHHQLPAVLQQVRVDLSRAGISTHPGPDTTTDPDTTDLDTTDPDTAADREADLEAELVRQSRCEHDLGVVLADAGYANEDTFTAVHRQGLSLLAPLASDEKRARGDDLDAGQDLSERPQTARAQQRLQTPTGKALYKLRGQTVEPAIGQLKDRLGIRQFSRRGLPAVQAEFSLACTVHNIRKLFTWNTSPATA